MQSNNGKQKISKANISKDFKAERLDRKEKKKDNERRKQRKQRHQFED